MEYSQCKLDKRSINQLVSAGNESVGYEHVFISDNGIVNMKRYQKFFN